MLTDAEVLQGALVLPASQRADIARRLLESLDHESMDPDSGKIWAEELESRAGAYDRGEVAALEADEVFEKIQRSLRQGTQE